MWSVVLSHQSQRIYQLTFSLSQSNTLLIGSIQGPKHEQGKELIKQITKQLYGMRPQQLMIWLAWQMADKIGVTHVQGIANINHPRMHFGRRLRHSKLYEADYDEIWQSYNASQLENGNWEIPRLPIKPLEQIESQLPYL